MSRNGKKRERGGERGVGAKEEQARDGGGVGSTTSIDWQEQYELIRRLNNETEQDLQDILELKKKSDSTFEQKIKLLENKLTITNEAVRHLETTTKKVTRDNSHVEQQDRVVLGLRKEIEIYQILSGVKLKEEGANRYVCTLANENTGNHVKFAISTSSASSNDIEYEPIENSELLPEYLKSNLAFDRTIGPIMLGDAITSLFPPEE